MNWTCLLTGHEWKNIPENFKHIEDIKAVRCKRCDKCEMDKWVDNFKFSSI